MPGMRPSVQAERRRAMKRRSRNPPMPTRKRWPNRLHSAVLAFSVTLLVAAFADEWVEEITFRITDIAFGELPEQEWQLEMSSRVGSALEPTGYCGIALLIYVGLAGWREDNATRCRECRSVLRNLDVPQCPKCGEPV